MPVNQYPGIPQHQIKHYHIQRMHHLHSPPPPPIFPADFYPAPFNPPAPPPMFLPAPPPAIPLDFQPFAPPPQQPEFVLQRSVLENRVDYSARLLDNFNSSHQNCHNR